MTDYQPITIQQMVDMGRRAKAIISLIQSEGYGAARRFYNDVHRWDGRVAHGAAVRASNRAGGIGDPKPYIVDGRRLYILDLFQTLEKGEASYFLGRGE